MTTSTIRDAARRVCGGPHLSPDDEDRVVRIMVLLATGEPVPAARVAGAAALAVRLVRFPPPWKMAAAADALSVKARVDRLPVVRRGVCHYYRVRTADGAYHATTVRDRMTRHRPSGGWAQARELAATLFRAGRAPVEIVRPGRRPSPVTYTTRSWSADGAVRTYGGKHPVFEMGRGWESAYAANGWELWRTNGKGTVTERLYPWPERVRAWR